MMKRICSIFLIVVLLAIGPGSLGLAALAADTPPTTEESVVVGGDTGEPGDGGDSGEPGDGGGESSGEPKVAELSLRYERLSGQGSYLLSVCLPMTEEESLEVTSALGYYSTNGVDYEPVWNVREDAPEYFDFSLSDIEDGLVIEAYLYSHHAVMKAFEKDKISRFWLKLALTGGIYEGFTTPALLERESEITPLPENYPISAHFPSPMVEPQPVLTAVQKVTVPAGSTAEDVLSALPTTLGMMVSIRLPASRLSLAIEVPYHVQWAIPEEVGALTPGVYRFTEGHTLSPVEEKPVALLLLKRHSFSPPQPTEMGLTLAITVTEATDPPLTLPPVGGGDNGGSSGGDDGDSSGSGGNRGDAGSNGGGQGGVRPELPQTPTPSPELPQTPTPSPELPQTPQPVPEPPIASSFVLAPATSSALLPDPQPPAALAAGPVQSPPPAAAVEAPPPAMPTGGTQADPPPPITLAPTPAVAAPTHTVPVSAVIAVPVPLGQAQSSTPTREETPVAARRAVAIIGGVSVTLAVTGCGLAVSGVGPHMGARLFDVIRKIRPKK